METLRTLFVRNVPVSVNNDGLKGAFAAEGEVLQCFLVAGKDPKKAAKPHRGCGFVEFRSAKEAKSALERLNGTILGGNKIQVEIARPRASFKDRKKRKVEELKNEELRESEESLEGVFTDPVAQIRTLAIGGVTCDTSEGIEQKAREIGEVQDVLFPVSTALLKNSKLESDGCSGGVMLIAYKTVNDVTKAVSVLHGQDSSSYSMPKVSRKKKKRQDGNEDATQQNSQPKHTLWCRQLSGEGRHLDKHRVILRNLPFGVTEVSLREEMEPAGFVWKLDIPKKDDGKMKGFAFATFTSNSHAHKAKKLMDGKKLKGRKITAEIALPKNLYEKKKDGGVGKGASAVNPYRTDLNVEESDKRVANVVAEFIGDNDNSGGEGDEDMGGGEKTGSGGAESEELEVAMDEDEGSETAVDSSEAGSDIELESLPEDSTPHPAQSVAKKHMQEPKKKREKDRQPDKYQDGQEKVGRDERLTVFVRGLPLDCSQELLQAEMERFGPLKSCILVENKETGKRKGSAFVQYVSKSDAEMALGFGKKASSGDGPGLFILGTQVYLSEAITSQNAQKIAQEKANREKPDKRNMYLVQEGRIDERSLMWKGLSSREKAQRTKALAAMRQKLRDPNCYLSKTRLMVRNLPRNMDDVMLKELLCGAVVEHDGEAKPEVKHAIVLMDQEKGKTQCRGFVEFAEHEHALAALKQLNGNPFTFTRENRPIVEFAVENIKKVRLHEARVERRKRHSSQVRDGIQPSLLAEVINARNIGGKSEQEKQEDLKQGKVSNKERKKAYLKEKWLKIRNRTKKSVGKRVKGGVKGGLQKTVPSSLTNGISQVASGRRKGQARAERSPKPTVVSGTGKAVKQNAGVKRTGTPKTKKGVCGEGHDRLDDLVSKYQSKFQGAVDRSQRSSSRWFE